MPPLVIPQQNPIPDNIHIRCRILINPKSKASQGMPEARPFIRPDKTPSLKALRALLRRHLPGRKSLRQSINFRFQIRRKAAENRIWIRLIRKLPRQK